MFKTHVHHTNYKTTHLVLTMFLLSSLSEWWNELTLTAMLAQVWCLPFLIWLEVAYTSESNKWVVYVIMTLFLSQPYGKLEPADYDQIALYD